MYDITLNILYYTYYLKWSKLIAIINRYLLLTVNII